MRHPAERRRMLMLMLMLMQEIVYRAETVTRHSGLCASDFGLHCSAV